MSIISARHVETLRQQIMSTLPEGSVLTLSIDENNVVNLDLIFIKPDAAGQGAATRALRMLCEHADRKQWVLALAPVNSFGADIRRLRAWYYSWGFQGAETMVRYPR